MSEEAPIFGIDVHKHYQPNLDFDVAAGQGFDFTWLKIAEGPYRDGTVLEIEGLKEYYKGIKRSGSLIGFYGFAVESDGNDPDRGGRLQAEHFLQRAEMLGGVAGKGVCIDFEAYNPGGPYEYLTPSNATLKSYIAHLRETIGDHPIVLYSGPGFWNGGDPSGPFEEYGADVAWSAAYPYGGIKPEPQDYYQTVRDWGWQQRFGGVDHMFWQFTAAGTVAHHNIDVDAFRGSREELLDIFGRRRLRPKPARTEAPPDEIPAGTPQMPGGYPPFPGATTQWAQRANWVVGEIRKEFGPVVCATYGFHGREGEPWNIDVMVSPFRQKADASQEAFGDRIQLWLEDNWMRLGVDYLIWWNWMNDGAGWFDYTPWSRPASLGGWPGGDPHPVPRRHEDHLHIGLIRS